MASESGELIGNGRNSLQPLESFTKDLLDRSLEIPLIRNYVVSHFPDLVTVSEGHPSFNGGLLYLLGNVTRETNDRSISLRNARAEAYKQLENPLSPTENDKIIVRREIERKRLTRELFDHHLITVDTKYGKLGGQVSVLNPETEGAPILFIPGSSNDPESVESGVVSLALLTKRKVVVLGYPEAPNGLPSPLFSNTVIEDTKNARESYKENPKDGHPPSYAPYVEFFDKLIHSDEISFLTSGSVTFDLWGHSGGGAISAKLLSRKEYQDRVNNAVILNPGGSTTFSTQSARPLDSWIKTFVAPFRPLSRYPRYTWWDDPRKPKNSEDKHLKVETWKSLIEGSHYQIPEWPTLQTKKSIVVYSAGKDEGTKSYQTFNNTMNAGNPSIHVLFDPNAHHNTVFTHPDETIQQLLNFQKEISQQRE